MRVIMKRPGEAAREAIVDNTLSALQGAVGGYIEAVPIAHNIAILCDEEGRLLKKPKNCRAAGIDFVGTILIVGVAGEDFADCPISLDTFNRVLLG